MNRAVCTICADYLTCDRCTACPCGHTFHYECIIRWKKQSSTCPQCRVRFKVPTKLYFELSSEDKVEADPAVLQNEVTDLKLKLRVKDSTVDALKKENGTYSSDIKLKNEELKTLKNLLENSLGTNDALKRQLSYLEKFKIEAKKAKEQNCALEQKMISYRNIHELVEGERNDIETTIKNFADNPDSFSQIATSYVVLKKEFTRLKDAKKGLENDKRMYRKKAESSAQEAFESKEKLTVLTNDLKHLHERNKSLSQKLQKLEQSFASESPRTSAIKRLLLESPAPTDLKRQCVTNIQMEAGEQVANESIILFDGLTDSTDSGYTNDAIFDLHAEESMKIADEFGLHYVGTTSAASERQPLAEINKNKNNKSSFVTKKPNISGNCFSKKSISYEKSELPHLRKGFNGMGGQSKILVLPKRTGSFAKPTISKKNSLSIKLPKNAKITFPTSKTIELSP